MERSKLAKTVPCNTKNPHACSNFNVSFLILSQLQDLAVSPGVRDPRLNTAECVIEGHEPDITATGRSPYIKAILWCSFLFAAPAGPYLAFVILDVLEKRSTSLFCCQTRQDPLISSIISVFFILFFIECGILVFAIVSLASGNAPSDIYVILGLLATEGAVLRCFKSPGCCTCDSLANFVTGISTNLSVYHFCWLVIGIMINPTWGLAVLLIVCFFVIALTFALYRIFDVEKCCDFEYFIKCVVSFCGVCSLVVLAVLAGQSFYGRETADDIMKTVLLYVISGLISWISWKKPSFQRNGERREEENQ